MALTALQGGGRGVSFDDYFKMALGMDTQKLEAIIRGKDHSLPIVAAMAAYEVKKPMATAAAGQQAAQQLQQAQPTVRQKLEQKMDGPAMIPDMAMLQQQRMGPQPPVLPEQAGVGALPAPNMEGMAMAHGGIVAFDDGGEVERYADAGLLSAVPPPKKPYGRRITDTVNKLAEEEGYQKELFPPIKFQPIDPDKEIAKLQQQLAALPPGSPERGLIQSRIDALMKMPKPAAPPPTAPAPNESAAETARLQRQAASAAQPEFIDARSRSAAPAAPAARTSRPAPAPTPAPQATPAPAAPEETGIAGALKAQQALAGGDKEIKDMLAAQERETTSGIEDLRKMREKEKPAGEAYSKYEQSLQKEEREAKGKEDRNLRMALLNAGLAMMAGTSPYALENIGKGAMVGTKQYMDGIDKLEAAGKKRQEALAMIEQARRAEAREDYKAKNEFEAKAFELQTGAKRFSIDALAKIYGTNKQAATDIFNNMEQNKTRMEAEREQSRSRRETAIIAAEAHKYAADAYGGRQMTPAMAVKEANDSYEKWAANEQNQLALMKNPRLEQIKRKEILIQTFKNMGIPLPPGAGNNEIPTNLPPLSQRTDLFK
jgi:hypothetical protein